MADGPTFGKRARALTNMDYDEVSLVDVPANQHAMVMISKRHTQGAEMPDLTTDDVELYDHEGYVVDEADLVTGDVVYDSEDNPYEYTSPEDMDERELVGKGVVNEAKYGFRAGRIMRNGTREANGQKKAERASDYIARGGRARRAGARAGFGFTPEAQAAGRAGRRGASNAASAGRSAAGNRGVQLAAAGAAGAGGGYAADRQVHKSFSESISKALAEAYDDSDRDAIIEEFAKAYDAQQNELDELASIAKSERDTRLEGEYIEVAKNLGLPGDPGELGPVLKRMSDVMDPADVEVIAKTLDGISGILYEEFGYDGFVDNGYSGSGIDDAEAAAEARISKAGSETVSKAAGVEQFYVENPGAYDEYLANRR